LLLWWLSCWSDSVNGGSGKGKSLKFRNLSRTLSVSFLHISVHLVAVFADLLYVTAAIFAAKVLV